MLHMNQGCIVEQSFGVNIMCAAEMQWSSATNDLGSLRSRHIKQAIGSRSLSCLRKYELAELAFEGVDDQKE